MRPLAMTLLLLVTLSLFAWSARRRWRLLRVAGRPENRADQIGRRVVEVLKYVFAQQRMPRYPLAGWAHVAVFFGFMVLLLNSIMLWVRGYASPGGGAYDLWLFGLHQPLGIAYAFLRDIFIVFVLLGVLVFFYNRVVARLSRLTLNVEGVLILSIIFTMMIADLFYEGGELIHRAHSVQTSGVGAPPGGVGVSPASPVHYAMPFSSLFALGMNGMSPGARDFLWHAGFWVHSALVLIFLNLLPYGKHFHVLTVVPNVFARQLTPRGKLRTIADIEGKLEREETLGVKRVHDLSWKDVLDFYTCTECGRCSDQCPATRTGKLLSPKHLLIGLRDHLYARESQLLASRVQAPGPGLTGLDQPPTDPAAVQEEAPPDLPPPGPPHGARNRTHATGDDSINGALAVEQLAPAWINPSVLWACTTCAACEEECPVFITYIDKIVDLRRNLVLERGEFPEQLQTAFRGLETAGNPYSYPNEQRAEWAAGLDVPLMAEESDVEYLYWVGCAASFDDRSRKIARALAQLLKTAGVSFAILGPEEQCNGDPARRAGNEFLFQMLAGANVETLTRYNVRKILTACPHCYNTLKHEYPDFGGHFEVVHHSELLAQLIRAGRLQPRRPVPLDLAFHDACYLGRHNGIYDPPREVLAAIPGVRLHEAEASGDRGMCCGAGGAQMWKEEEPSEGAPERAARVNHERVRQLLAAFNGDAGADGGAAHDTAVAPATAVPATPPAAPPVATAGPAAVTAAPPGPNCGLASACPFCKTMLTDSLADQGHEAVRQLDIAEILWEAVREDEAT